MPALIHLLTSPGDLAASTVVCGDPTAALATWDVPRVTCPQCLPLAATRGLRPCTCRPARPVCPACRAPGSGPGQALDPVQGRLGNAAHRGRQPHGPALKTEQAFQEAVRELATTHTWLYYHPYDSRKSPAGFPDTVCVRGPRLLCAELKMPGTRPTPAQQQWLDALAQVTQVQTFVWYPQDFPAIGDILSS